jgi:hypothetical protein
MKVVNLARHLRHSSASTNRVATIASAATAARTLFITNMKVCASIETSLQESLKVVSGARSGPARSERRRRTSGGSRRRRGRALRPVRGSTRLSDNRMLRIKCLNLRLKRSTVLGDKVKKSILAIALAAPFVALIPSVTLAADAGLPVGQRAARHYRVVEECGWRHCPTRCPDRYSCAPLYGAYGPWGGQQYWAAYSYSWGPSYYYYTK